MKIKSRKNFKWPIVSLIALRITLYTNETFLTQLLTHFMQLISLYTPWKHLKVVQKETSGINLIIFIIWRLVRTQNVFETPYFSKTYILAEIQVFFSFFFRKTIFFSFSFYNNDLHFCSHLNNKQDDTKTVPYWSFINCKAKTKIH